MLHQAPAKALAKSVPLIDLNAEMKVFDFLPEGCIAFPVTSGRSEPLLRVGDVAVIDTNCRSPEHRALFVIRYRDHLSDTGHADEIVETYTKLCQITPTGPASPTWWAAPAVRPRSAEELDAWIKGRRTLVMSDGPYAVGNIDRKLVVKVIGVLAASAPRSQVPALPAPVAKVASRTRFDPARFCIDLEAIGGFVVVTLGDEAKVSVQVPVGFDKASPVIAKEANRIATKLTRACHRPANKAPLRAYAVGVAEALRKTHPTGSRLLDGVFVIDAPESRSNKAGRA